MEATGRFDLPLIMPNQAQKHVTHNEALTLIDGICHLVIQTFGNTQAPATAAINDAFVVGVAATGSWFGEDKKIAFNTDVGWRFVAPRQGMIALNAGTSKLMIYDQSSWQALSTAIDVAATSQLGINTNADATNRLSVRTNATLMTALNAADGGNGDIQLKLNKELVADTASLLYQNGFSGRAEMGLAGDDDFRIKVSADGSTWTDAIVIDKATGVTTLANNSIANAALADMAPRQFKARISASSGDPQDITAAQATSLLDVFSTTIKGLVPASGGGVANFLRADGTWVAPAGGSGGVSTWGAITGTLSLQADLQSALNGKEGLITVGTSAQYIKGDKTLGTLNKVAVGLANADNTSDAAKPISTATASALAAKAELSGAVFTGAISGTSATFSSYLFASGYIAAKDIYSDALSGTANARINLRDHLSVAKAQIEWNRGEDALTFFSNGNVTTSLNHKAIDGIWRIGASKVLHDANVPVSGAHRFYAFEDFMTTLASPAFVFSVTGTGAVHAAAAFPDANAIGAVQGTLGNIATNRISVISPSLTSFRFGQGVAKFAARLRIQTLSDATNAWTLRTGFIDSNSAETVDGAFFRYTNAVNFEAVTRSNGVETAVDTLIPVATGTTYKLEVEVNATGTAAVFKINGAIVATTMTNIPTAGGRETGYGIYAQRTLGTAMLTSYLVDYLMVDLALTTAR